MKTYRGSCHCGAVRFTARCDVKTSARCDCSICRRRGSIMVRCDQDALKVQTGLDILSEYRFNTDVAIHYFCARCGIYTFHKMRKLPDTYAVNAGCLEDVDMSALDPITIKGSAT